MLPHCAASLSPVHDSESEGVWWPKMRPRFVWLVEMRLGVQGGRDVENEKARGPDDLLERG